MLKLINRNLENLFIIAVSVLSIWGLWVLSDAYCLFSHGYSEYSCFRQLSGLVISVSVFFIIQKLDFGKLLGMPLLWLILAALFMIFSLFFSSFDAFHNRDLRNLAFIPVIAFGMFCAGSLNRGILYSSKIKYAVFIFALARFWITLNVYSSFISVLFFCR